MQLSQATEVRSAQPTQQQLERVALHLVIDLGKSAFGGEHYVEVREVYALSQELLSEHGLPTDGGTVIALWTCVRHLPLSSMLIGGAL